MLCDIANALLAFSTATRSQRLPGCHADLPNQAAVRPASFCSSSSFRFSQRNPRLSKDTMAHQHVAKVYSIETAWKQWDAQRAFPHSFPPRREIEAELCNCPLFVTRHGAKNTEKQGPFETKEVSHADFSWSRSDSTHTMTRHVCSLWPPLWTHPDWTLGGSGFLSHRLWKKEGEWIYYRSTGSMSMLCTLPIDQWNRKTTK